MAAVSKFQNVGELLEDMTCREFLHPWTNSCTLATLDMFLRSYMGAMRFFLPLQLIPLVFKYRQIDRTLLLKTVKSFLRSSLFGATFASGIYYWHCAFRVLLGRYYNSTAILIPSIIGCHAIFVEDPNKWAIYLFAFCNTLLEWLFNMAQRRARAHPTPRQLTVVFMLLSGTVMYMLRTPSFRRHASSYTFWFYFPPKAKSDRREATACPHEGTCIGSIIKETGKLMGAGIAVQLLRMVAKHITAGPRSLLRRLFTRDHYWLGLFLGSYVAVFKAVSCLLCRFRGRDSELHAIPAGVLAGATFLLHPNVGIAMYSLTTILQILVSRLLAALGLSDVPALKGIAFGFCAGVLVNAYFMDKSLTPRVLNSMLHIATCSRTTILRNLLETKLKKLHLKKFSITVAGI